MNKAAQAALGVLLAATLVACGSDDKEKSADPSLSKDEKAVAAKISKAFTEQTTGKLSTKEADCFAESFVDKVGLKKLESAKLITADGDLNQSGAKFDADVSGKFADAFLSCVDYAERQAEEIADTDSKVDAKKLESCLREEMPDSYVKKLIVASQTQASDAAKLNEESNTKLTDCKKQATK